MTHWNLSSFLEKCRQGGLPAYEQFKGLLSSLEDPAAFGAARKFFQELYEYSSSETEGHPEALRPNFHFSSLAIGQEDAPGGSLILLQLPSTFTPEEWSFTFYEGLARYTLGEFQGKVLCELGCGNGWITLALSEKFLPEKIYGLDINPRAITCAKLNLYLNGTDPQGRKKLDGEGKSLFDRVEFHTSDLLQYCLERKIGLDRIVGCIPQVLGPDPKMTTNLVSENESDEFLYALSNYCGKQGLIEDQFGLGLVARALEEGILVLNPLGKMIFNLGGRPGEAILDRLFSRRGFHVKKVWQRKVEQAADTEIGSLVEIEKNSPHRFEFFMGPSGKESISAKTAYAFQQAGGSIFHSLTVYDAYCRHPGPVQRIMRRLSDGLFQEVKSAVDLSYKDTHIGEERITFLADLADYLGRVTFFPYGPQEGLSSFRKSVTKFLDYYFQVPLHESSIILTPGRTTAIKNLFMLYRPSLSLVTKDLAKTLGPSSFGMEILESPLDSHLVVNLVGTIKPSFVVASLSPQESVYSDSFLRLMEAGQKVGARVVVDISHSFELSSTPQSSTMGIFEYLSKNPLPPHVILLCGFIRNQVYSDLEVGFVFSENSEFLKAYRKMADLTYCRSPLLSQMYYQTLLQELLKFQIPKVRMKGSKGAKANSLRKAQIPAQDLEKPFGKLPAGVVNALDHHALKNDSLPLTPQTIRLDYGENELNSPVTLKTSLFESFVRQNLHSTETDPRPELAGFLKKRFGLHSHPQETFFFGHGVTPLFAALMEAAGRKGATLVVPQGTYGYFMAIAQFFGVKIFTIPTQVVNQFKITASQLQKTLSGLPSRELWVFLNFPVVNPTGAIYAPTEIKDLLSVANLYQSKVIMDTIFSGLEYGGQGGGLGAEEASSLENALANLPARAGEFGGLEFVLLGGISKEFSAGGLRFGFAYTRCAFFKEALKENLGPGPHSTVLYAVKKTYHHLDQHAPALIGHLLEQKRRLKVAAQELAGRLSQCGWEPLHPHGGLFLVAKPSHYIGKKISTAQGGTVVLDADNIPDILYQKTNLLINGPLWTGLPDYCRFVISVEEKNLTKALVALNDFYQGF